MKKPTTGMQIFYPTGCDGTVVTDPDEKGSFIASTPHPHHPRIRLNLEHRGLTWALETFPPLPRHEYP